MAQNNNKNEDNKRKQVESILRTPIESKKKYKKIELSNGIIYSSQEFNGSEDEDMSDFAIGFYKILYSKTLKGEGILCGKDLADCCFAGDTMNSYNTIAKLVKRRRNPLTREDINLLNEYYNQYHCLANFWILPSCLGRRGRKGNNLDSMDIFLNGLNSNYEGLIKKHKSYYESWKSYSSFQKAHFIKGYEYIEDSTVRDLYKDKNGEKLIGTATDRIERRAKDLSESTLCNSLWNYFDSLNLFSK